MQIHLRSIPTGPGDPNPFGPNFVEFPWAAQFRSIRNGAPRKLLGVELEGELVGGMTIDPTCRPQQLIFFEVLKGYRGRGIGKTALLQLIAELRVQGETELFVQTGRTVIYRRMGFHFRPVERSGLIIDLDRPLAERSVPDGAPLVIVHDDVYLWHDAYDSPESPDRLARTFKHLEETRILEELTIVAPRYAEVDDIAKVHDPDYIRRVKQVCEEGGSLASDVKTCRESFDIARLAYGGSLLAGDYVEEWRRVFVLCRPPGHHASRSQGAGFCIFNNMAGLALALQAWGFRPLIIDWDAHHGNGTQELLYEEPIPYISFHQRDLYPWTGTPQERGKGAGLGFNYNFPLPPLCTDEQFMTAFRELPEIVDRHRPDVLLVSAGQDGHHADKLSGMMLSSECFEEMARTARNLANRYTDGRIILLLEGGYNLEHLGHLNTLIAKEIAGLSPR